MTSNQRSEKLLLATKMQTRTDELVAELENLSMKELEDELINDDHKKAFWINIYNAFFQILRKQRKIEKPSVYKGKHFSIAGQPLSLDDVEHGILRKYRYKFSLGYLPNPFFSKVIKKWAVSSMDYRIHFGLNCGAKSCPPIAFYSPNKINEQLDTATVSFLDSETTVLNDQKEIHITKLFQWFLGDFGGKKGIRAILQKYLNLDTNGFELVYTTYSWEEELDNYVAIIP